MQFQEIVAQAQEIISLYSYSSDADEEYKAHFKEVCNYWKPEDKAEIHPKLVHKKVSHKDAFGDWWYTKTYSVVCRDTGVKDHRGRTIYQTPENKVFVFRTNKTEPEYDWRYDGVCAYFEEPRLK